VASFLNLDKHRTKGQIKNQLEQKKLFQINALINTFNIMENKELTFFNLCLRTIQHEKGWNLSEIADQLKVTLPYLSKVKTGKKPVSSKILFDVRRLADMSNAKAISIAGELYNKTSYAKEPEPHYSPKHDQTSLIEHFIKDSSAKSSNNNCYFSQQNKSGK
jgi:transcriptional regulator with XRE-family HTH domain